MHVWLSFKCVCVCVRAHAHMHMDACMWMHACVQVYMWEHCFQRYNRNHHIWTIKALAVTTTLKITQQMLHHMCYLSCKVWTNPHIKVQLVFKQICQHLTVLVRPNTSFKALMVRKLRVKIFVIYNQGHSSWHGVHLVNLAEQWKRKSPLLMLMRMTDGWKRSRTKVVSPQLTLFCTLNTKRN